MKDRVLELATEGTSIRKERGFIVVSKMGEESGRVPIDEIGHLMVSAQGVNWSSGAMRALAERGVPVFSLDKTYTPTTVTLPLDGKHDQSFVFRAQANARKPLLKRAWGALVKRKLLAQAEALDRIGESSQRLRFMAKSVRSGDPENLEGQGASIYWPKMMGEAFRRNRDAEGVNAMLNYGYAILRSATARAIVSAGLHPSLSVHHRSNGDAMVLADDLMEPFRPTIDLAVRRLAAEGVREVPGARKALAATLEAPFAYKEDSVSLALALLRLARSVARSFLDDNLALSFPTCLLPQEAQ